MCFKLGGEHLFFAKGGESQMGASLLGKINKNVFAMATVKSVAEVEILFSSCV